ncbi:hypothetical protein Tco_0874616 [Tanacetum coccineum]|uniref:Uncharacterized protein n=1 Tax=Tanacetum coccineum TaxID=301880 RepID=A0ABQ5BM40_9ASTR
MITPHPTPFLDTTPCTGVLVPFVIISDSDDKITTLPVRPTPSSPDRTLALYGYPLDSGDDSSDEDLKHHAETLQVSLGAARMDVRDLIESHEADEFEMAELRSRAQDIEASFWDFERHIIVAQRVVNAIETIAIYEAKARVARDLMNQVERQEEKVAENASNKRKWKGNHNNNNYNQNKRHEVARVYTVRPTDKGKYAGNLPHCKPLPEQQTRKTTRGTHLPTLVVDKKGIIGMNV